MKINRPLLRIAILLLAVMPALAGCIDPQKARREALAAGPAVNAGDWPKVEAQMLKATQADRRHPGYFAMLGRAQYEQEKWEPAKQSLEKALSRAHRSQHKLRGLVHQNLAKIHHRQNNLDKAVDAARKAITALTKVSDRKNLVLTYNLLGEIYSKSGRRAEAEEALAQSLKRSNFSGLDREIMLTRMLLGHHYARYDEHEKAIAEFRNALPFQEKSGGRGGMGLQAHTRNAIADAQVKLGQLDQAIAEYTQARNLALKADFYQLGIEMRMKLSDVFQKNGNSKSACAELRDALTQQRQYDNPVTEHRIVEAMKRQNCPAPQA